MKKVTTHEFFCHYFCHKEKSIVTIFMTNGVSSTSICSVSMIIPFYSTRGCRHGDLRVWCCPYLQGWACLKRWLFHCVSQNQPSRVGPVISWLVLHLANIWHCSYLQSFLTLQNHKWLWWRGWGKGDRTRPYNNWQASRRNTVFQSSLQQRTEMELGHLHRCRFQEVSFYYPFATARFLYNKAAVLYTSSQTGCLWPTNKSRSHFW